MGSNFNLTYGLKTQVSSIKIVTLYIRRHIFQVEWLKATLILMLMSLPVYNAFAHVYACAYACMYESEE